ncbi:hypothetical protein SUDANB58_00189 [Streptomyces sp. enrichment culture]|uniref:hypothetical protein n=1 Tax=Streptomyces sp. enrichment culture TaxID=1795815 RepID=UPI003F55687F
MLHFPFHVVLWAVVVALLVACALVMELVCGILPFLERPVEKAAVRALDPFPARPRWWMTWGELRHEEDPAFHRGRVEKLLRKQRSDRRTTDVAAHLYRCLGVRGLLEIAGPHGWTLDAQAAVRPHEKVRLSRLVPAATRS